MCKACNVELNGNSKKPGFHEAVNYQSDLETFFLGPRKTLEWKNF